MPLFTHPTIFQTCMAFFVSCGTQNRYLFIYLLKERKKERKKEGERSLIFGIMKVNGRPVLSRKKKSPWTIKDFYQLNTYISSVLKQYDSLVWVTWSHDNSYVFYVKCGSIKRTFTYVFTGTKMYNTDVFPASKHTNTYIFSAFKRTKLWWPRELNMLQLQKTHTNRKSTSKSRKHLHQFESRGPFQKGG